VAFAEYQFGFPFAGVIAVTLGSERKFGQSGLAKFE
jgi:hypothetical protein